MDITLTPPPADPFGWIGSTLAGQFTVDGVVGEGGFGIVYRGMHLGLEVPVGIKCLKIPADLRESDRRGFLARLRGEARLLHKLSRQTANIVQALDVGAAMAPSGDWTPYMVMEWLEGQTLELALRAHAREGRPSRGISEAIDLLSPAVAALAIAHRERVAHLDLKPSNLVFAKVGGETQLKVLDFGVAKVFADTPKLTRSIGQWGAVHAFTPQYGAPEQFSPQYGVPGPWTDVFAVALLLIEIATGRPALEGEDVVQLFVASIDERNRASLLARVAGAGERVLAVLRRALDVNADLRFRDLGEMWAALATARAGGVNAGTAQLSASDLAAITAPTPKDGSASDHRKGPTVASDRSIGAEDAERRAATAHGLNPTAPSRWDDSPLPVTTRPASLTPQQGVVIGKRYTLVRLLASGGMGSIWIAHHRELDIDVTVKFMAPTLVAAAEARTRFEREAKAVARLRSQHVVQVHDYGVEDGTPYIVMELLQGEDLHTRLHSVGRLSVTATVKLVDEVARGLEEVHASGIVHRDLKPGNLFFVRSKAGEHIKILDFGIAKMQHLDDDDETTRFGVLLGTLRYMSPEQARSAKRADSRSDLWSLAVIAFRALTGRHPFPAQEESELCEQICFGPIPLPSLVAPDLRFPVELDAFFTRAFNRDPDQRFQSATDLSRSFAEAVRDARRRDDATVLERRSRPDAEIARDREQSHTPRTATPSRETRDQSANGRTTIGVGRSGDSDVTRRSAMESSPIIAAPDAPAPPRLELSSMTREWLDQQPPRDEEELPSSEPVGSAEERLSGTGQSVVMQILPKRRKYSTIVALFLGASAAVMLLLAAAQQEPIAGERPKLIDASAKGTADAATEQTAGDATPPAPNPTANPTSTAKPASPPPRVGKITPPPPKAKNSETTDAPYNNAGPAGSPPSASGAKPPLLGGAVLSEDHTIDSLCINRYDDTHSGYATDVSPTEPMLLDEVTRRGCKRIDPRKYCCNQ